MVDIRFKPAHKFWMVSMSLQGGRHPMTERSSDMEAGLHTLMTGLLSKAADLVMPVSRSSTRTMTASLTAWTLVSGSQHYDT